MSGFNVQNKNNKILVKKILIGPLWGELRLFRVVLRLRGMKKFFKIGPKFFSKTNYMTLKGTVA